MNRRIGALVGLLVALPCLAAQALPATLSVDEARQLVDKALPAETKRLPGLDLEVQDKKANVAQCWTFEVLWANSGEGSAHVGFWAVDRRTGDVWQPTSCTRVTGRDVGRAGEAVRKRLGVSGRELSESRARPVCCP